MTAPTNEQAKASDAAKVTMFVDVEPALAFEVFTTEIDQWWRRGPRYRMAGRDVGAMVLEPRLGGRVFEQADDGGTLAPGGTVTAWEPPSRVAFSWRGANFAPDEITHVDVRFEPSGSGTRVTLVHSGWAAIRPDHPARHGKASAAFLAELGMWWSSLVRNFAERAAAR